MVNLIDRMCPMCNSSSVDLLLSLTYNEFISVNPGYDMMAIDKMGFSQEDKFNIVQCQHCQFQYTATLLVDHLLSYLYEHAIDHDKSRAKIFIPSRSFLLQQQWSRLLELILSDQSEKLDLRILDYGCGWGNFLEIARAPGINCFGYELDRVKIEWARQRNLIIFDDEKEIVAQAPYDLIYCNQVLEHVPNPVQVVQSFARWLKPGGVLYASVPCTREGLKDIQSLQKQGRSIPKEINPWEHLNYFTPRSFSELFQKEGFVLLEEGMGQNQKALDPMGHAASSTSFICRYPGQGQNYQIQQEQDRLKNEWHTLLHYPTHNMSADEILMTFSLRKLARHLVLRIKHKFQKRG